jgi:predicted metalloprotease with PDZ domain
LNLKSELLADFSFQEPRMSQHLWLYEGVTDYLSWQAKLKAGLIGLDEFLNDVMRAKMLIMNKFPEDISFTDWSSKILEEPWKEQYMQVYNKGTITAMFLDFEIMRLTHGQKNLADVIFALCTKFKDRAFKEEEICDEFTYIVHPDLKNFFMKYIAGKEKFDFKAEFGKIGLDFQEKVTEEIPVSILDGGYGVEMAIERVRVYNIVKVKPESVFKKDDKILYDVFGENCTKPFRDLNGNYVKPGTIVGLPIIREGKEMELQIPVQYAPSTYRFKTSVNNSMTKEQEYCFRKWCKN